MFTSAIHRMNFHPLLSMGVGRYVFFLLWCVFAVCGYVYGQGSHLLSGRAQGTTYQIKYYGEERVSKCQIDSVLKVLDRSMSLYDKGSIICKFNDPLVSEVLMDAHMTRVVKASQKAYKDTRGYFDITVYPLVKLWGFGAEGPRSLPRKDEVDSVRRIIGMEKLRVKGNRLIKRVNHVSIDLNGIAQGYSVDVLADYLKSKGVEDYLVELGGEIRSLGSKPEGPFLVELYRPEYIAQGRLLRVRMVNNAITSSGVYEQQRNVGGRIVSHHMNPLTGQPLESTIVSVTVIAKTAMEADALDNYFMSLTPEEAIQFANKRKDVEVYLVCSEGNTFKELQSSGFNNYIY
ncbi:FAD:protein FMN transferase [Sphingobacterium paucimobilis]|nr:FAD:protein FMN transferase [Sphingobacterium paucimobilis]